MKPVIKKQTHYNLLLMRDDTQARSFRMHSTMLRFLIIFFVLLVLLGALGIAGGAHFWKQYLDLSARSGEQEREIAEMRLQLERLSNLECLIVASNGTMPQPQAKNQEVGASPLPERPLGAFLAGRNASLPPANATAGASPFIPSANATAVSGPLAGAPGRNATAAPGGAAQANATAAQPGSAPEGKVLGRAPSISSPGSPVRINRFSARPYNQQRLRISYELSTANPEDQLTVTGGARYVAVFGNGTRLELPLNDADGTRFTIQRMKPMQSTARIPQGHSTDDIASVDVYIDLADGKEYHDNFPVSR